MKNNETNNSYNFFFNFILCFTLALLFVKLTGMYEISWLMVFTPIIWYIIGIVLILFILLILFIFLCLFAKG